MSYNKSEDLESIQADVLGTDTSSNTKLPKLKQLKTETKIPTKAINALNDQLGNATANASDALQRVVNVEATLRSGGTGSAGVGDLTPLLRLLGKDVKSWTGYAKGGVTVVQDNDAFVMPAGEDPMAYLPDQVTDVKFANALPEAAVNVFWDVDAVNVDEGGVDYLVTGVFGPGYFSSTTSPVVSLRVAAPVVPTVYGMVLNKEGSTPEWVRVDQEFNTVDFDGEAHQTYANMRPVTVDDQEMVEIPVTYVKTEVLESGPYTGKTCWWTADYPVDGFHPHTAFIDSDGQAKPLQIAAWLTSKGSDELPRSVPKSDAASDYWGNIRYTAIDSTADLLNINGTTTGWHGLTIHEYHLLARLLLTEFGTPDVHSLTVNDVPWNGTARVVWRGINDPFGVYGGKMSMWLSGMQLDGNLYVQLLANDGSGEYVTTNKQLDNGTRFMKNCIIAKGAKYDFGDLFIAASGMSTTDASFYAGQTFGTNKVPVTMFTTAQLSGPFSLNTVSTGDYASNRTFRLARHVRVE